MATPRSWQLDDSLDWPEHYVRYGFCLLRGLLDRPDLDAALAEVQRLVGDPRPIGDWTIDRPGQRYTVYYAGQAPAIERLFATPPLAAALEQFFGSLGASLGSSEPDDPDRRRLALWVNPYDPDARPRLQGLGHIDSGSPYRGMAVHIALAGTKPFSGNTTYVPGSHVTMHHWLRDHPDPSWPGGTYPEVPRELPAWEFVAEPGDVVFTHHLVFHSANPSHAEDRSPRIAIRQELFPRRPLADAPLDRPGASVFERSLAFGGPHQRSNT
ncbi:phytanoyl-CoA dioxygenase family protein [Nannocystaceae bacterium ST9]